MAPPHGAAAPATPGAAVADAPLYAEQIRLLFRFSLVGYLATLLVIFILGAIHHLAGRDLVHEEFGEIPDETHTGMLH